MLHDRGVPFEYEKLLIAPADGTFCLPDFTIMSKGEIWFWEHVGRLDLPAYAARWKTKKAWYEKHYPGRLLTTDEGPTLSHDAQAIITAHFS